MVLLAASMGGCLCHLRLLSLALFRLKDASGRYSGPGLRLASLSLGSLVGKGRDMHTQVRGEGNKSPIITLVRFHESC